MRVRLPGFTIATATAWLIAVGSVTGIGGVVLPSLLVPAVTVLAALSAWVADGLSSNGRRPVPLAGWLLYTGLLVAASAWHVDQRGRPVIVELYLPMIAVLLVLAPIPLARSTRGE